MSVVVPIHVCEICGTWRYIRKNASRGLKNRTYPDARGRCILCEIWVGRFLGYVLPGDSPDGGGGAPTSPSAA